MGSKNVISSLKKGKITKLIYADNMPELKLDTLKYYANISEFGMEAFKGNSIELGRLCGKPFGVLLIGIKR